jgi:hypothetical protein
MAIPSAARMGPAAVRPKGKAMGITGMAAVRGKSSKHRVSPGRWPVLCEEVRTGGRFVTPMAAQCLAVVASGSCRASALSLSWAAGLCSSSAKPSSIESKALREVFSQCRSFAPCAKNRGFLRGLLHVIVLLSSDRCRCPRSRRERESRYRHGLHSRGARYSAHEDGRNRRTCG